MDDDKTDLSKFFESLLVKDNLWSESILNEIKTAKEDDYLEKIVDSGHADAWIELLKELGGGHVEIEEPKVIRREGNVTFVKFKKD